MQIFTAQQMRDFDKKAVEEYGIPSIVLMENAALRVVEFLEAKFSPLIEKRILILCGKGNNGGDGFCIARHLQNFFCDVSVVFAGSVDELQGDALLAYQIYRGDEDPMGNGSLVLELSGEKSIYDEIREDYGDEYLNCDIVIDALLGTGFKGPIRDNRIAQALSFIQDPGAEVEYGNLLSFATQKRWKVAVDLPSGLNADTGEAAQNKKAYDSSASNADLKRDIESARGKSEQAKLAEFRRPRVDYTISFVAPKCGMLVRDGLKSCGEIWIGDIGARRDQLFNTTTNRGYTGCREARVYLTERPIDAHKGSAGRVLIIGGSVGMSGAVALASRAALRVGAGLCAAAIPASITPIFAAMVPEATSHALPCDENGQLLPEAADLLPKLWENADVVALGPGLSRSESALEFARRVMRECPKPLIIDADALYALRGSTQEAQIRIAGTILTPHPGEMGELMGMSATHVNENRFEVAEACAKTFNAVVVLKGARSIVANPRGYSNVNLSGNSGMGTGGSGDVLTGTIAGWLAQRKMRPMEEHNIAASVSFGTYLHGLAGDICFRTKGNGLIAGDIVEALPLALEELKTMEVERINGRLRRLM